MFYNQFGLKSCKDTYFYYDNQSFLPFVFFICNKKTSDAPYNVPLDTNNNRHGVMPRRLYVKYNVLFSYREG